MLIIEKTLKSERENDTRGKIIDAANACITIFISLIPRLVWDMCVFQHGVLSGCRFILTVIIY